MIQAMPTQPQHIDKGGQAMVVHFTDKGRIVGKVTFADQQASQARMMAEAAPPAPMQAAPVAPARGTMQLQPNYEVTRGGIRRQDGAHWTSACALTIMNARAQAHADAAGAVALLPFNGGHIAIAAIYRALVEWREGSAMKCIGFDNGGGGAGSGLFIDTFMEQGERLDHLRAAIGTGKVMVPRRNMDRGNSRVAITARALVDMVVVEGRDLSSVLVRHGWVANGLHRKELRTQLVEVLDRMQGFGRQGAAK
jgi:hypothetical protein